jgi:hypothetical protein
MIDLRIQRTHRDSREFWRTSENLLTPRSILSTTAQSSSNCSWENKKNHFKRIDALRNGNWKPVNSLVSFPPGFLSPISVLYICLYVTSRDGNIFSTRKREYLTIVWSEVSWPAQGELGHCSVYRERSQVSSTSNRTTTQWRTGFNVRLIQSHFYIPLWSILYYETDPPVVDGSLPFLLLLGRSLVWIWARRPVILIRVPQLLRAIQEEYLKTVQELFHPPFKIHYSVILQLDAPQNATYVVERVLK